MTRIFLPPEQLGSDPIVITGDNARHLTQVLRVHPGNSLVVFDGNGFKYDCTILKVHKKEIIARLISKAPYSVESPFFIALAQGMPKADKMDLIIQKSTELGVNRIIPLVTDRSQIKHTGKLERWRKIALSASQQSGREKIPEILDPVEFGEFINNLPSPLTPAYRTGRSPDKGGFLKIIFSEEQSEINLKKILLDHKDAKNILILVGPEGGFSKEEISIAVKTGFQEVSLGPRILRTETAPLTAISIIQYELGDIGQDKLID